MDKSSSTEMEEKLDSLFSDYLKSVTAQDDAARKDFNLRGKESIHHIPLSERHYLILGGEISGITQSIRSKSDEGVEFSRIVNKLVRSVISKFPGIKISDLQEVKKKKIRPMEFQDISELDEEFLDGKNFLFYLIKNEEKKNLKILVAISGFGRAGKKFYSVHYKVAKDNLEKAIELVRTEVKNEPKYTDYKIEGIFVPFSRKEERYDDNNLFSSLEKTFNNFKEDKFIRASLIAKILQGNVIVNSHTVTTLFYETQYRAIFIADFNEAHQISQQIKNKIKVQNKENKYSFGDPGEFIESITLTLLNNIEEEQLNENIQKTQGNIIPNSGNPQTLLHQQNIEFLKEQSYTIHFNKPKEDIETFINSEKVDIVKYKESLKKVWWHSKKFELYTIMKYQARCSEDNLIDYLMYNSDILKEEGIHYIFSVKKQISKNLTKNISIRPPCSYCILHFPLELAEIARKKVGLPNFKFNEHLKWSNSIKDRPIDEKLLYMSKFAPESYLKNIFETAINTFLSKYNEEYVKNAIERDMKDVLVILNKKYPIEDPTQFLYSAALVGSTNVLEFLISEKNVTIDSKFMALYASVQNNHLKTIEKLLQLNREKDIKLISKPSNKSGISPLHLSTFYKRPDIFKSLVERISQRKIFESFIKGISEREMGKFVRTGAITKLKDLFALKPLCTAIFNSNIEMIKHILDHDKDIVFEKVTKHKEYEWTPLHIAVIRGDYEIVELLVKRGFLTKKDSCNMPLDNFDGPVTALQLAIHQGYLDIVKLLLDRKVDENIEKKIRRSTQVKDGKGNNLLHILSAYRFKDIIKLLLEEKLIQGEAINVVNKSGITPLHFAAAFGYEDILEILIESGAHIKLRGDVKQPLHFAAIGGHKKIVQILIDEGANIEAKGDIGERPLHEAALKGRKEVVEFLLESGADVNAQAIESATPLHLSAEQGHKDVVEVLLRNGADINAKTENSETPAMLAGKAGHREIVEIIVQHWKNANLL